MFNKFKYVKLEPRYNGDIIIGKLLYFDTQETLEFYYSFFEDTLYPTEKDKELLVKRLRDKGILQFIQKELRNTKDINNYIMNFVA